MEILELKNTITKREKKSHWRDSSRFDLEEENISKLEEWRKKRMKKNEKRLRVWDTTNHTNICIIGVLEGEESERTEKVQIMTEKFPNLMTRVN